MDEELLSLRRAAAESPTDEAAARAYDAALRRAGKPEEVYERFRFKFECPKKWEELDRTGDGFKKNCKECGKTVFWARTERELHEHAVAGRCVAFHAPQFARLLRDERIHTASDEKAPCVLPVQEHRWPTKEEWAELERRKAASLADPRDVAAARAYDQTLLALGDEETLWARVLEKYECAGCERCRSASRRIEDLAEVVRRVAAGESVEASAPSTREILAEGIRSGALHGAEEASHGCLRLTWPAPTVPVPRPLNPRDIRMGAPLPPPKPPKPSTPPTPPSLWKRIFG